jgi:hypothetical protein
MLKIIKNLRTFLFISLFIFSCSKLFSKITIDTSIQSNGRFELNKNDVIITFDLSAPEGEEYEVSVMMKMTKNAIFEFPLKKNISGDIGIIRSNGKTKKIIWKNYTDEFPQGAGDEDYYFEITLRLLKPGFFSFLTSSKGLPYLIGGSAAIGGGIYYLFFANKKNEEFPPLPGRPPR